MRIGILTGLLSGGGAERQAAIWARLCAEQGHDVTAIVLWRHRGEFDIPGVRLIHLRKSSAADFATIAWRLRKIQHQLDALIAFEPYLAFCCALANLRIPWMVVTGKVPYLLKDGSRIPLRAYRMAFDRATLASAPNQAMIDCHRELGLRAQGSWALIPNVADAGAFTAPAAEREGILFVGRLVPVKNPMLAVESAAAAGAALTLLGEGELQAEIETALAARNGGPPVRIHPYSKAPWPIYARHRVLLVTSLYESFGNVLVESLASGTPVVSVDCDFGPRGIIGDATYSHLTGRSVGSVAAALSTVLERPYGEDEASECLAIASRYRTEAVAPSIMAAMDRLRRAASPGRKR